MELRIFFITITFLITIKNIIGAPKYPVIAIMANPDPDDSEFYEADKVNVNYVRWLESAGAETVVIHTWYDEDTIKNILSKSNGVLFQGGSRTFNLSSKWEKLNSYIFEMVKSMFEAGTYYPLWGTCQGFELIHSLVSQSTNVLTKFDAYNMTTPILETDEIKNSRMFSLFTKKEKENLGLEDVALQFHHLGVSLDQYNWIQDLNKFFIITSLGRDREGKTYVNSVESRNYPIYAVQFHPEHVPYSRSIYDVTLKRIEALEISQNLGEFFVNESRKNGNKFSNDDKKLYEFINSWEKGDKYYDGTFYIFQKSKPVPPKTPTI